MQGGLRMRKSYLTQLFLIAVSVVCMWNVSKEVSATTVQNEIVPYAVPEYMSNCVPEYYEWNAETDENGAYIIDWYTSHESYYENIASIVYEAEFSSDEIFMSPQKFEVTDSTLKIERSLFGENGGKFYIRIRSRVTASTGEIYYSNWSETKTITYMAINKHNFPGLYKLLKKGGTYNSLEDVGKVIYDKNEDGWLDSMEIDQVFQITSVNYTKVKKGIHYSVPYVKMSSLKGIEHFPNVNRVKLTHFSGNKIDLSANNVKQVDIRGVVSNKITVIAPDATSVFVESHYDTKLKLLDVSKCVNAVEISAYGSNKTKDVKLPKKSDSLKILSVSDISVKELDVNVYPKLQQLYAYKSDVSKLKNNKCKELRYLYFYFCKKIKSVDITKNTKLRGMDVYSTPTLTQSTIKRSKKAKVTWGKGKWWYSTKKYKSDMKKIFL